MRTRGPTLDAFATLYTNNTHWGEGVEGEEEEEGKGGGGKGVGRGVEWTRPPVGLESTGGASSRDCCSVVLDSPKAEAKAGAEADGGPGGEANEDFIAQLRIDEGDVRCCVARCTTGGGAAVEKTP